MRNRLSRPSVPAILAGLLLALAPMSAQQPAGIQLPPDARRTFAAPAAYVPDLAALVAATSELRDVVQRFSTDRQGLLRFYTVPGSIERRTRLRAFQDAWLQALSAIDFAKLSQEGKADYVLLRNHLEYQQALLGREERNEREIAPLVPFAQTITRLAEDRQKLEFVTADQALAAVQALGDEVEQARAALDTRLAGGTGPAGMTPAVGVRASQRVDALRGALQQWFAFYNGYDPAFTEKVPAAYQPVAKALTAYSTVVRQKIGGLAGAAPAAAAAPGTGGGRGGGRGGQAPEAAAGDEIVGDPIGREGLLEDLAGEMIPYTPEQLIEIGNREYAWCETEMKKASRELGFGDDWMKALEAVKNKYVPAGGQPAMIRNLALEAEAYLKQHDLVTVPPLASDIWRMQMMSPERQRVNPFFTGGETISVSYPTNTMTEEERLMSMRGNGVHVSRATVQHELIPGHHLQLFMAERANPHRALFGTPFYTEGWALYWEFALWDKGFPRSAEDRIGMLWWRMHRATRIIFSLNFHLGRWTPEQCIDFLVTRGGHERFTATGEVRRSFAGSYSPLYQAAYMLGGLQLHALAKEVVPAKMATVKAFNDAVLWEGRMPLEILRAVLDGRPLTRDYRAQWRFYGDVPAAK
ncbi:MAG: DUF885 family protein [Vicinamibacterales bacterium]